MKRPDIVKQITETMHRIEPTAHIILYGSEARGDAKADSDIDLLVLLEGEKAPTPEEEWNLRRPLSEIEAQTGVAINALFTLRRLWEQMITPFTINVNKEGIAL